MTDRDPVQEAVERAVDAWPGVWFVGSLSARIRITLAAALAPYGGLEAIKKLEATRETENDR